jgi:threonine dehydrogenase-like Zn-dependent dehydrogenase
VLAGPRRFELAEVPRPEPRPGEVRVRVEGCGVCGSNLPPWQGRDWFRYPFSAGAPGHEGWGVVTAAGPAVRGLGEGDRVALLSTASFAEEEVLPAELAVPIPPGLEGPFPGEAIGCAVNVVRRSRIAAGETVAVVGAGFLGLVAIRLAALAGARVLAVSRRRSALALARRLGAEEALPVEGGAALVLERTGGRGCDVVVEAVGLQGALDLASAAVREGGRLVIAGFHQDGTRAVDLCAWNWRGVDIVNAHERDPEIRRAGVVEATRLVTAGLLDPALLLRAYPLAEIGAAFLAMEERPDGFVKAVVTT